jgi:predicted ATP-dependent Lon-type protease
MGLRGSGRCKRQSVQAGLVVLGDLSIQGNIKPVKSLSEPLQVVMDSGARQALVPIENKRNFVDVPGDVVERIDLVFFSDPLSAAVKELIARTYTAHRKDMHDRSSSQGHVHARSSSQGHARQ